MEIYLFSIHMQDKNNYNYLFLKEYFMDIRYISYPY